MVSHTQTKRKSPDVCPICGAVLKKVIIRLEEGQKHAFLFLEICPITEVHYSHYRPPEFSELIGE